MNEKQQALINGLAEDLKPLVTDIEAAPKTTMNNYGRYGSVISQLSKGNKQVAQVIALALIQAGASRQGVGDALRLLV